MSQVRLLQTGSLQGDMYAGTWWARKSQPWKDLGKNFLDWGEQQVKSPWGRNKPGIFLSQKESSCGWGRMNQGESGMRCLRITKDPILGSPVFRPWEQGSQTEFCDGGQWRFLSWGIKWSGLDFYKTTPPGAGVRGQEQKQGKPWAGFSRRLDSFIINKSPDVFNFLNCSLHPLAGLDHQALPEDTASLQPTKGWLVPLPHHSGPICVFLPLRDESSSFLSKPGPIPCAPQLGSSHHRAICQTPAPDPSSSRPSTDHPAHGQFLSFLDYLAPRSLQHCSHSPSWWLVHRTLWPLLSSLTLSANDLALHPISATQSHPRPCQYQ